MLLRKVISTAVFIVLFSLSGYSQPAVKKIAAGDSPKPEKQAIKSSPAYAELLLRKTERESEIEEFMLDYTDEFPKVKELKFELNSINKEMDKLLAIDAADAGKLTLALGKLLVRKTEIETDWWNLSRQYNAEHPEVKRAKRKIEVYEKAVKEILP